MNSINYLPLFSPQSIGNGSKDNFSVDREELNGKNEMNKIDTRQNATCPLMKKSLTELMKKKCVTMCVWHGHYAFGYRSQGHTRPDNKKWCLLALAGKLDVPSDITNFKASNNN